MARRVDVSLDGLHQLLHRIERKELVDGDWAVCGALVPVQAVRVRTSAATVSARICLIIVFSPV